MQTFLFTDIEGSTRLWSRAPVAMAAAVQRQEALLRATIEQHQGDVFKTVGDGIYAVFARPEDAVEAAVEAQRLLLAEEWSGLESEAQLTVRIAMHTGPAETRDGDYFGPALNRLSRTLAAGHGGQILCTDTTLAACGEHWPEEITLRDLGERTLRDVPGNGHIFQVVAPGLQERFPPLATLDLREHNLPHWPTRLIGRDDETAQLLALLRARDARLVTMLGAGGVGKTRLATEAAAQLLDEFQNGIRFVDLSALRGDTQVVPAIVQVTGATDQLLDPRDALIEWLHSRSLLLVLDNCEQVVEDVASITSDILSTAPEVVVLATSRVAIRVRGERQFALEPLPLPPDAAHAEANPGVRLFAERAQEVSRHFRLDDESAPIVAEICRSVDGLPLGIELAAAWVRMLSPAALHRRLQEGRAILRDGARDLPDRQRTLAATIAWSYDLLDPEDQRAFRRLAVFRGGIPVDAAAAVIWEAPIIDPLWALSRLDALVQANLLQVAPDPSGEPRFRMLQTIHEFATGILREAGEWDEAARSHADFFANLAAEAQLHYRAEDSPVWLDLLDLNFENFRAAIEFDAAKWDRNEVGLHLVVSLAGFLDRRCHQLQAREWLVLLYREDAPYSTELRVEALWYLGNTWFSNPIIAGRYYRKAIEAADAAGDARLRMRPVSSLSIVASLHGDHSTAMAMAWEVMRFGQQQPDPAYEALGCVRLAQVASEAGLFDVALLACAQARNHQRDIADLDGESWTWLAEGRVHRRLAQSDAARIALDRAYARFSEIGDEEAMGACQLEHGLSLLETEPALAREAIDKAVSQLANVNDAYWMIALIEACAKLLALDQLPDAAAEMVGAARRFREQTGIVPSASDAAALQIAIDRSIALVGTAAFEQHVKRGLSIKPRVAIGRFRVLSAHPTAVRQ